jgi:hypothetical protein
MSEESKLTKGPWHVCDGNKSIKGICSCMSISCADHPIATVERGEWGDHYPSLRWVKGTGSLDRKVEAYMEFTGYGSIPDEEAVANAHMLAAAPELLEALKAHLTYCESGAEVDFNRFAQMRDHAIEKAEGREVVG